MPTGESDNDFVIRTRGLSKSYGPVQAVRSLDLRVRRGEIYGFLGRNGAGKTTTIRMLLGLARPSAGSIDLFGRKLGEARLELLGRIGYLVEGAAAYPNLSLRENLEIQRRLTGSPRASVDAALERLGLGGSADRRAGQLSLGNRQRLSIARALLHAPELLILDEPANALDPAGIVEIRKLLRQLADEEGLSIFMSSHILAEVEQLADRIGIIHEGSLVEELDREALQNERGGCLEVEVDDPARAESLLRARLGLTDLSPSPHGLRIGGARAPEVARELVAAGIGLHRLQPLGEDLESRFMRLTGGAV